MSDLGYFLKFEANPKKINFQLDLLSLAELMFIYI